jgi:hypothetical protein
MISEIKRVKVLQAGNVGAALYGLTGAVLLLLGVVVLLVHQSTGLRMLVIAVLFPVFGFFAWIMAAALYNLAARMVGGLQFEHECIDDSRPLVKDRNGEPEGQLPVE